MDRAPRVADAARLAGLARLLGTAITGVDDATRPWATTRSLVVRLADGRTAVAQWPPNVDGFGRRVRLAATLPRLAPDIPVPALIASDSGPGGRVVVTRFVPGTSGGDLLATDASALELAAAMGRLSRRLAQVPARGLRLPARWTDPERLVRDGERWLARSADVIDIGTADRMRGALAGAAHLLRQDRPVFAHGDLAPVNVILEQGRIVAVLDFERARVAHPLFDAAWWRWIVRYHHPERWAAAWPAFAAAAGIDTGDPLATARLDLLGALQCLEEIEGTPRRRHGTRLEWARRVAAILSWSHGS